MRSLEYNFTGFQVPVIPRASRSARGRGSIRKKCRDNQIRAFEILASVAGNLLQESESSVPTNAACVKDSHHILYSNSKRERGVEGESLEKDPCCQGNCSNKSFAHAPGLQEHHKSYRVNGFSCDRDDHMLEIDSTSNTYGQSEMIIFAEKWATVSSTSNCGCSASSTLGDSPCFGEHFEDKAGCMFEGKLGAESYKSKGKKDGIPCVIGSSEDLIKLDMEPHAQVGSESDAKASLLRDCISHGPFPKHCDHVKVVSRDDDENSVECTQASTISKFSRPRPPPDIGERKIKKLSASRQWRPQNLKGAKMKPMYCNGTYYHKDERSQNIYPFKKRKFYSQSPLCPSDGGFHHEDTSSFPKKRNCDNCSAAIGASSSVTGQVHECKGCNVKLSIKSFKVPELFIEIPATATVGSLKRTVMEAMTAVLGNGLHVGILLQGKMVRDDNKTLLQTGISQDQKRQNLGFILEPRHTQITPPVCTEDPSLLSGGTSHGISRDPGLSCSSIKQHRGISCGPLS
ncbi:hypothetical protein I3843_09G190000 [Carya illinoinensis]|nr:hypothetical protein I3843_09G190000 [Carya illinoinensis]KAG7964823.1 hypothetical protein I3843_09G190000 [Carya illinoinensis]KAG7964824.1 hypothetical protein I3843_09G190000 [Carya illinoinensis]KAG7964825.1 hypothetical protein I3843_09G190000 [Carya illinoinensis]